MSEKMLSNVQNTFSMYGLVLPKSVGVSICKCLEKIEADERETWLTSIMDHVFQQNLGTPHVTLENIEKAMREYIRPESTLRDTETIFDVINAFETPKIIYDQPKKKFVVEKVNPDLYPDAVHKSAVFSHRLELLWHKTHRHELFTPLKFGEENVEKYKITPIEYLLSESKTGHVYVMGVLSQLTEGQYYLEDKGGAVKIDLKRAADLVTEGCIVIASGSYENGILVVTNIGFPPAEATENSRAPFANANTFGGPHPTSLKNSEKLKVREESNADGIIIFVSDFWVDDPRVLEKFQVMLDGYANYIPIAFVLCGHFLSFPPNVMSSQKLKEGFVKLAEVIQGYPEINKNAKFVFVPGPYDLGSSKILPRGPLPESLLKDFIKRVPNTIFTSNPCRIQYCTKEIIVFREDMLTKFCRNTLKFPTDGKLCEHYAKLIICQSHLAPMNLPVIPVHWKHDHALQIFPIPDLIVVADQFEAYKTSYEECQVINPGTFSKNEFRFKTYEPAIDLVEDCVISNVSNDA